MANSAEILGNSMPNNLAKILGLCVFSINDQ